jgi:SPOR domain
MTDVRADELAEDDRLPWLEAVEEDDDREGPSLVKLIGAIVIGLAVIAMIVGGLFWLGNRNRSDGNGEIIAAPEGDYKVRPDQPGGMKATGEGETAAAASAGAEPKGRINTNAVAETPVARPPQPAPQPPAARPQAPPARPPAPPVRSAAAPSGATIQLGAFSTQAGATSAWRALSGRFRYLAPLGHSVVPVQSGGRTLYRLRASGPDATGVCRRLQVAGEDCAIVG